MPIMEAFVHRHAVAVGVVQGLPFPVTAPGGDTFLRAEGSGVWVG